jgi:hypothetical protein
LLVIRAPKPGISLPFPVSAIACTPEELVWWMSHEEELDRKLAGQEGKLSRRRYAQYRRKGHLASRDSGRKEGVKTTSRDEAAGF